MQRKMLKTIWFIMAAVLLAATVLTVINREEPIEIPDDLFGYWTTTDPKYADRHFDLSSATVTFGLGDDASAVYAVDRISAAREHDRIVYTVTFKDEEGVAHTQSMAFHQNNPNQLVFINQQGTVWHKQNGQR